MTAATAAPADPPIARRRRGRALSIGLVAAVGAVAVVAALLLTGAIPLGGRSTASPAPSPYLTYDAAQSRATSAVTARGAGPWSPLVAIGVVTPLALSIPAVNLTSFFSGSDCVVDWPGGAPPSVTVPVTPDTAPNGTAGFWLVAYDNASLALRLALVSLGNASTLVTVTGSSCTSDLSYAIPLTAQPIVDSPVVADNVSAAGGGAWLRANANATETWEVLPGANLGGIVTTAPTWRAVYTTCSLAAGGPADGSEFSANLTAETGYVLGHHTSAVACPSTGGLGLVVVAAGGGSELRQAL
jgi:hypothetical protein